MLPTARRIAGAMTPALHGLRFPAPPTLSTVLPHSLSAVTIGVLKFCFVDRLAVDENRHRFPLVATVETYLYIIAPYDAAVKQRLISCLKSRGSAARPDLSVEYRVPTGAP